MQFVLNNQLVTLSDFAADMTLLRYLRTDKNLMGTKEGCASGDCGACTVLVGRETAQGIVYRAVNACICPLASLHQCYLLTVEGLAAPNQAELHPVQEALVACHGSQCGFCTPGFVMSLAGLHQSAQGDSAIADPRAAVLDAVSGNLCRCTGYKPIIAAGMAALKKPAQLANIVQTWEPDALSVGNTRASQGDSHYWQPETESELRQLMVAYPAARLIAGGTDMMLEVTQAFRRLPQLIDLNLVASLKQVAIKGDELHLGAALSYAELEQALISLSPEFVHFLQRLGSRQIRNRGTLGGNIANASPIADTPPYLLVLNAELIIGVAAADGAGQYRRQPLSEFYRGYKQTTLQPGEYLHSIVIGRQALAQPLRLFKISKRYEDDISAVMGAFYWDGQALRIAYGGMAATPMRALSAERVLQQQAWLTATGVDEAVLTRACAALAGEFTPMSDVRASAQYRLAMAANLLKKACYEFAAQAVGAPIAAGLFDHA